MLSRMCVCTAEIQSSGRRKRRESAARPRAKERERARSRCKASLQKAGDQQSAARKPIRIELTATSTQLPYSPRIDKSVPVTRQGRRWRQVGWARASWHRPLPWFFWRAVSTVISTSSFPFLGSTPIQETSSGRRERVSASLNRQLFSLYRSICY